MQVSRFSSAFILLLARVLAAGAATKDVKVTVQAGDQDRRGCPVSFAWPANRTADDNFSLRDDTGVVIPLQFEGGRAWFIQPALTKGRSKTYLLRPATQT